MGPAMQTLFARVPRTWLLRFGGMSMAFALLSMCSCEALRIDQCVDRGGCWDRARKACEFRQQSRCDERAR